MSSSRSLGAQIVRDKEAHDLSRNPEFSTFPFIGYRTSATAVELVALSDADGMTEGDVVRRRDEFFDLVLRLPRDFGLKPRGRNPNGLLGFVFAEGCTEQMARFIAKQTRISHSAGSGGVSVAWAIDARNRRIHTHENPVSIFPPVIIAARTVYPGLDYLQSLLDAMPPSQEQQPLRKKSFEEFTQDGLHKAVEPAEKPGVPPGTPAAPRPKRTRRRKTRILFVGVDSLEDPLDLAWELKGIEANLRMSRESKRLALKPLMAATMDTLTQEMLDDPPNIIHFSGHGEQNGLVLRDEKGGKHAVSGVALAKLIELFPGTVQCVILNACSTDSHARAIHRCVPHVIGVRAPISDETAIAFSSGFYKAIGAGKEIPFAYKVGMANAHAADADGAKLITLRSRATSPPAPA